MEAGEKLGFLPGDLGQKNWTLFTTALWCVIWNVGGFERVQKLMERNVIEIAPLAYMRGRTLNDSFIILDESQNTTVEQMKMFWLVLVLIPKLWLRGMWPKSIYRVALNRVYVTPWKC